MAAQQAQWTTQQPTGWDAQQEDPYAASYYEAYPATPGLEVYPAPAAYPAVPETPAADEYQKKRADDLDSGSWSLCMLRVCTILMVVIVSGLILFVMVGGNMRLKSHDITTAIAAANAADATANPTHSSSRNATTRNAHRGNERAKSSVQPEVVTGIEGYNFADHVAQYRRVRKKAAVRAD